MDIDRQIRLEPKQTFSHTGIRLISTNISNAAPPLDKTRHRAQVIRQIQPTRHPYQ
jgi:hypothetical protein